MAEVVFAPRSIDLVIVNPYQTKLSYAHFVVIECFDVSVSVVQGGLHTKAQTSRLSFFIIKF